MNEYIHIHTLMHWSQQIYIQIDTDTYTYIHIHTNMNSPKNTYTICTRYAHTYRYKHDKILENRS